LNEINNKLKNARIMKPCLFKRPREGIGKKLPKQELDNDCIYNLI